ncbi:MAG: hypothetical protein FJ224_11495, partial [Lentisphaerae bacterium]|nr:hypothetical protein [Lentisphaerota bacterium]
MNDPMNSVPGTRAVCYSLNSCASIACGLMITCFAFVESVIADDSDLKARAATFPAMPRDTADMSAFTTNAVTFASGAPFNDLEFTILDTDYMDGENGGFDVFLPVDTSDPVPGSDHVKLLRCALNTD